MKRLLPVTAPSPQRAPTSRGRLLVTNVSAVDIPRATGSLPTEVREATADRSDSVRWYARSELGGPWRLAVCDAHAVLLERHRFGRIEPPADRSASACAACLDPDLLPMVENCTCETDTGRCPEHSNLGCSC